MKTIGLIGQEYSESWSAAKKYDPDAGIQCYTNLKDLFDAFAARTTDSIIIPVYNTREGDRKHYFRFFDHLATGWWTDNIIIEGNISLGVFHKEESGLDISMLVGQREAFQQCEEYTDTHLARVPAMHVLDIEATIQELRAKGQTQGKGLVAANEVLVANGLHILERELAPHNRTRYAVLSHNLPLPTGYDASVIISESLADRVGLLVDILNEFSKRSINILDMRTESDIKTQKLRIYLEIEGYIENKQIREAVRTIESQIIQQEQSIRLIGSFPRLDMRTKHIRSFGFIGTGKMSQWFAHHLQNEGYDVLLTGRSTELSPESMIEQVDVVVICVPISVTSKTIARFGPLIKKGKALVILAGESEDTIETALNVTSEDVEVMLVHNLWGPQTESMKGKNAIIVRTSRSGMFCSEFEAFFYKYGASIYHDSPAKHDLLMGLGQKLPTIISVALAMTLHEHSVAKEDIASHCTLTSLYHILAMSRVHYQNPQTYAEIMATTGEGGKIVRDFAKNLQYVVQMAKKDTIQDLCCLLEDNANYLSKPFLSSCMRQAKALDGILDKLV